MLQCQRVYSVICAQLYLKAKIKSDETSEIDVTDFLL